MYSNAIDRRNVVSFSDVSVVAIELSILGISDPKALKDSPNFFMATVELLPIFGAIYASNNKCKVNGSPRGFSNLLAGFSELSIYIYIYMIHKQKIDIYTECYNPNLQSGVLMTSQTYSTNELLHDKEVDAHILLHADNYNIVKKDVSVNNVNESVKIQCLDEIIDIVKNVKKYELAKEPVFEYMDELLAKVVEKYILENYSNVIKNSKVDNLLDELIKEYIIYKNSSTNTNVQDKLKIIFYEIHGESSEIVLNNIERDLRYEIYLKLEKELEDEIKLINKKILNHGYIGDNVEKISKIRDNFMNLLSITEGAFVDYLPSKIGDKLANMYNNIKDPVHNKKMLEIMTKYL
jgi:hypothetical protein